MTIAIIVVGSVIFILWIVAEIANYSRQDNTEDRWS